MKIRNKKTGEIFNWREDLMPFGLGCPHPKSLAELCNDWEDVKEPLIEDEKIRRGLSEWIALYGEHEKIKYYRYGDFVVFRLCRERGTSEPEITLPIIYDCDSLREGKEYTITELFGIRRKNERIEV